MSDLARRIRESAAGSVIPKMILIAILVLVLLVPLAMIGGLVSERSARRAAAEDEIVRQSGGEQTVAGPMLVVPFLERKTDDRGRVEETVRSVIFLPRTLDVEGTLAPERRRRGIYEVMIYGAELDVRGTFALPDFSQWRVRPQDILWQDAAVVVELSGMNGLRESARLDWDGSTAGFVAAGGASGLHAGAMRAALPAGALADPRLARGGAVPFGLRLSLQGGKSIGFLPFGEQTRVRLASAWPSPSFGGAFLPAERTLDARGFSASWLVMALGRSYPQSWRSGEVEAERLQASRFAVDLMIPVDVYLKSERSAKHGILFVLLPFVALFLYEIGTGVRVHPMQYLLIGFAECLFYLLLLSLSEHVGFDLAYLVSAAATVALVSAYASAVLGGWRRAAAVPPLLAAAYGFLYTALQSEDYALLIGSLGLFVILATVMMLTRRIDWYRLSTARAVRSARRPPAAT
jgi:inner membrane protein